MHTEKSLGANVSSNFSAQFQKHFSAKVGERRSGGFAAMIEAVEKHIEKTSKPLLVVETGGLRALDNWLGDGQSTRIFDQLVRHCDGYLFTVDINPNCATLTRQVCSDRTIAVTADSVEFLRALPGKKCISLLYLDSFDLDVNNPEPSSRHHLAELQSVIDSLDAGTVIAVDDNYIINGRLIGKGQLIASMLEKLAVPLIFDGYQKVWQLP